MPLSSSNKVSCQECEEKTTGLKMRSRQVELRVSNASRLAFILNTLEQLRVMFNMEYANLTLYVQFGMVATTSSYLDR